MHRVSFTAANALLAVVAADEAEDDVAVEAVEAVSRWITTSWAWNTHVGARARQWPGSQLVDRVVCFRIPMVM